MKDKIELIKPIKRYPEGFSRYSFWRGKPLLSHGYLSSGGRNVFGRQTNYNTVRGVKKSFKQVDFKRPPTSLPSFFVRVEHDSTRTAPVYLMCQANGILYYIIGYDTKDFSFSVFSTTIKAKTESMPVGLELKQPGNVLELGQTRAGSMLHCLEAKKNSKFSIARTALTFGTLIRGVDLTGSVGYYGKYCIVRMPSGKLKYFRSDVRATTGRVGVGLRSKIFLRKAGQTHWLGQRPIVRGVAMNPVDHPHGGGEGRTSGGRPSVSPWGKLTKSSFKTRKRSRSNRMLISTKNEN